MAKDTEGIEIQERDLVVLQGLFESRVLTLAHMTAMYFEGRPEAAKKRVQKLKAAGLIAERPRGVREPSILFITRRAFQELKEAGRLDGYPLLGWADLEKRIRVSDATIKHELEVMDVKAAFVSAIRATKQYSIAEFSTWPALYEFKAFKPTGEPTIVRPDGFIRIHEKDADGGVYEHTCFLEVDRSTESQTVLAAKAHCYRDYYVRGGLAERYGRPRDEYEQFPFRVLVVCKTEERRDNIARRLLRNDPPILTQVWVATMVETVSKPLGDIWTRPIDSQSPDRRCCLFWPQK